MTITEEEINSKRTPKGSWTRKQLEEWGIPWPPRHGWKRRLIQGKPAKPRRPNGKADRLARKLAKQAVNNEEKDTQKRKKVDSFYSSREWLSVRYEVLKRDKGICQCCGISAKDGAVMNVDHIKPKWKYPELALDKNNLQTLCARCNQGKWGLDETDWRDPLEAEFRAVVG